ncbi:unnamed protein product [Thlaspi arvense]|uniref:Branched-chain-amino-acid aminotransferase n=1 Tax=Thlaspi arvense TaxID=13288 RepID=A0AAU9RDJ8_THLAR|nr:unnamed protein product [Thlaspi arvense]
MKIGLFEGLKAYRTEDDRIRLFRPEENARRMQTGADRLCMTPPSLEQFVDSVKQTVLANKKWVWTMNYGPMSLYSDMILDLYKFLKVPPPGKGALYIRPLLIGSGAILGVAPSPEYTFLIYASPVGDYHKVSSGLNLKVDHKYHRAHSGGTGGVKSCTNYSPVSKETPETFHPWQQVVKSMVEAKSSGFSDVLFLDSATGRNIEEVSACNIFIVKGNIVSTPPTSGTILPGITRKSIIELARDLSYQVQERDVSVEELLEAEEAFCTGTAVVVKAVETVTFHDKKYKDPNNQIFLGLHSADTSGHGKVQDRRSSVVHEASLDADEYSNSVFFYETCNEELLKDKKSTKFHSYKYKLKGRENERCLGTDQSRKDLCGIQYRLATTDIIFFSSLTIAPAMTEQLTQLVEFAKKPISNNVAIKIGSGFTGSWTVIPNRANTLGQAQCVRILQHKKASLSVEIRL